MFRKGLLSILLITIILKLILVYTNNSILAVNTTPTPQKIDVPFMPNDPLFAQQWGLFEESIGWLRAKKIMDEQFPTNYIPDNSSPVAAIIDISFKSHKDIDKHNYLLGQTYYKVKYDRQTKTRTVITDNANQNIDGHGNATLGIMGATMNNHEGIAGTGLNKIKILAIDAHYVDEQGKNIAGMESADINAAIDYILELKERYNIVVVNMSFTSKSNELEQSIQRLKEKDIIVVAAAGNASQNVAQMPFFPAAVKMGNLISVAELTQNLELSSSSNYGGNVNIAAPGKGMFSLGVDNNYIPSGGTSAAAPFVSGTIAAGVALYDLKKSEGIPYENITAAQLINLLYQSANFNPKLAGKVQHARSINVGKFMEGILICKAEAIRTGKHCKLSRAYPPRQNDQATP